MVSAAANEYTGNRYISVNSFSDVANANYNSQHFSVKGIWGEDFAAFDFLQLTPEASLLYTYAKEYAYDELNGGGANLHVNRDNANTVQLGIGGKMSTPIAAIPSVIVPEIHGMYLYNILNGRQNTIFNFIEGPTQVTSQFTSARSALTLGFALTIAVFDRMNIKGSIDVEFQDRYSGYSGYLNLKYLL